MQVLFDENERTVIRNVNLENELCRVLLPSPHIFSLCISGPNNLEFILCDKGINSYINGSFCVCKNVSYINCVMMKVLKS